MNFITLLNRILIFRQYWGDINAFFSINVYVSHCKFCMINQLNPDPVSNLVSDTVQFFDLCCHMLFLPFVCSSSSSPVPGVTPLLRGVWFQWLVDYLSPAAMSGFNLLHLITKSQPVALRPCSLPSGPLTGCCVPAVLCLCSLNTWLVCQHVFSVCMCSQRYLLSLYFFFLTLDLQLLLFYFFYFLVPLLKLLWTYGLFSQQTFRGIRREKAQAYLIALAIPEFH